MLKTKKRKKNIAGKKRKVWKDGGLVSGKNVLNLTEAVSQEDQPEVEHPRSSSTKSGKRKSHKGSSESMKKMKVEENQEPIHFQSSKDMSAWKNLFVPPDVLKSLEEQNFISPTPIQALALPSAIRDRLDVVGAAETGSGKTLAFGIPIIHSILKHKEYTGKSLQSQTQEESTDEQEEPDTESFEDQESVSSSVEAKVEDIDIDTIEKIVSENIDDAELDSDEEFDNPPEEEVIDEETETGCVQVLNNVNFDWLEEKKQLRSDCPLLALILEPTRELAIQVKNHLRQATKYTDIKIASVVGGMAAQKQKRMLKRHPEIVVATPGRLWELIEEGEPHLSTVTSVKSLVIDEADRMIEKGHFEELSKLLLHINSDALQKKKRQTFVFSATLTFVHSGPDRTIRKKVKMTETDKLASLVKTIGLKERPKIIDITTKVGTAETLTEARINCTAEEKDLYLYYFLRQYPGRTLVFANSKDCIRRLVSVFTLLKCNPFPLHADMHQRQRLKNLDRFSGNESGLLLASDVAARGLDIPNVHHVIHYQVPKTVENYVHRSGRTARACKEGLSVMLVGADDVRNYRKIISSLNRNEDLPVFPIEYQYLSVLNSRVNLATRIDAEEHRFLKLKRKNDWFQKAADELDIELDADVLTHDLGTTKRQTDLMKKLKYDKQELCQLLKQTVAPHSFSGKYPTKMGKLFTPKLSETTFDAVAHVKRDKTFQKQLVERIEKRNKKIDAKKAELMKIKKQKKKWKRKKKPKK